jgi:meso-butanediol dehydrogenase/(S,S)-butanediol dehydrogenase/diacetyl reductase
MNPQSVHRAQPSTIIDMPLPAAARAAVITGAASGIGRGIALRLARDGLKIVANDLPSQSAALGKLVEEIQAQGGTAVAFEADVSVEENVKDLVQAAVQHHGSLDVVRLP